MRTSVDFVDGDTVAANDRGFMYGDGVFETLRVVDGRVPLWPRHEARLREAGARLRLPFPRMHTLRAEIVRLAQGMGESVVRVTITRGGGQRGYAAPASPTPTVVVSAAPLVLDADAYRDGVVVRLCDTRLAIQPRLAGMKHLNRLEQVLARSEWDDPTIAEGLVMDTNGDLVCATAANLFAVVEGRLVTPPVDRCGVAGVARAEVCAVSDVTVRPLNPARLSRADEVFLTSAVRGILPVRVFGTRSWRPGPVTRALQVHWRRIGLPLPTGSKDSDR